jgi:hypothetical protein
MNQFFVVLVIFFSVFTACKAGHPPAEDSDFESISLDSVFSGQPKEAVLKQLRPLRLNLIEMNEALCDVPFAQKYRDSYGESFSAKDTEEIKRLIASFHMKFVEEEHQTPLVAVVVSQGVAEGLRYVQTLSEPMINNVESVIRNLSQPSRTVNKAVTVATNRVNQIVAKIAQGSPAVTNLANSAVAKFGLKKGFKIVSAAVPQAVTIVNIIRGVFKALGMAIEGNRTLIRIADAIAKFGRFVKIALRGASKVAGGYADTLAVCEISNALVIDLEFWELQAKYSDPEFKTKEQKEYLRLLGRYCARHRQKYNGKEPFNVKCPKI